MSPIYRHVGELMRASFFAVPVAVAFNDVIGSPTVVSGRSMQPTLNPHIAPYAVDNEGLSEGSSDVIWEDKLSIRQNKYDRGSIVVFRSPLKPEERLVKRLIAVGGDWVRPDEGDKYATLRVPKGYCWVEGDNYGVSEDSNHFGPIPLALIEAKVTYIIWPPQRIGKLAQGLPSSAR